MFSLLGRFCVFIGCHPSPVHFFCVKLWQVPSFRFGDVYDVGPGSRFARVRTGGVWTEWLEGFGLKENRGIFRIQSEDLKKKHFHSFWILSFFCFFLSVSHKKSEASRFEMYDIWDFSAEDFSNTVAIFQESPCTCSLSLLGPPRHVYSFERSIYSFGVGLF